MTDYSIYSTRPKARWGRIVALWAVLIALMVTMFSCEAAHAEVNMEAIKQIESGGNPRAYNKGSGARGLYQITPICLKHFNQATNSNYTLDDLYNPGINWYVAGWYFAWLQQTYGFDDVEAIIGFNAGPKRALCYRAGTCDLPQETVNYLTKYQALTADKVEEARKDLKARFEEWDSQ